MIRMFVQRVEQRDVAPWFIVTEKFILSALEHSHDEIDITGVVNALNSGKMQLFTITAFEDDKQPVVCGACVTEVTDYQRLTAVRVVLLGGVMMHAWFPILDGVLMRFCEQIGATRIEAACRVGFKRALEQYGYKQLYVVLGKEVKHGESSGHDSDGVFIAAGRVPDAVH